MVTTYYEPNAACPRIRGCGMPAATRAAGLFMPAKSTPSVSDAHGHVVGTLVQFEFELTASGMEGQLNGVLFELCQRLVLDASTIRHFSQKVARQCIQ